MQRQPCLHHCTSEPLHFFGRADELAMLDKALAGGEPSLVALIGPGGQGKTAIVQHWLKKLQIADCRLQIENQKKLQIADCRLQIENQKKLQIADCRLQIENQSPACDPPAAICHPQTICNLQSAICNSPEGVFLWSFYRGKDSDLCLRSLYAYAEGMAEPPEVSASYCVDQLLPVLRRERWAVVLDGTEVVQHESGSWFGRFLHPELGRLLEELASAPLPGVVVLTSRFPLPTLSQRFHARLLGLSTLDAVSAGCLLHSLGVKGAARELEEAGRNCGLHAKAVELLGTYLARFHDGELTGLGSLPPLPAMAEASAEEIHVSRLLSAFQQILPPATQDILALATRFRQPPTEGRLLEYLASAPVQHLLHQTWQRAYRPFVEGGPTWLAAQVQELVQLRLLERVGGGTTAGEGARVVIDAHPLVRSGFDSVLGPQGHKLSASSRGGFLRGRPERQPPATLEEAGDEVELFHAQCDAGLWNEADSTFVALDNPKHRFLAPAFERDLLLRFFPQGDWRQPPLWPGFGRHRSLAICLELLGQFEEALAAYRTADAPLRGDALIALGRLPPFLEQPHVSGPWQPLWQAYRAHALCLLGQTEGAVQLARSLVPQDIYEWVHLFECLLRAGQLAALDLPSLLYRPPLANEHRWSDLARRRMRADYLRLTKPGQAGNLDGEYREILEAYDRAGLCLERTLTRLSYGRLLLHQEKLTQSESTLRIALELAQRHDMTILAADALELLALALGQREQHQAATCQTQAADLRNVCNYRGNTRP